MRGAIFDMDGLLIDTERLFQAVWREMAAEQGVTLDPAFPAAICGTTGADTEAVIRSRLPMVEPRPFIIEANRRVREIEKRYVPLKPGAEEILAGLKGQGFRIAVASSSPMEMIRHNLDFTGLAGYFHELVSGLDYPLGKPHPDIFLGAAERLGLPPAECYVFEDSLNGVEAGIAAGCFTVMIPDLVQPSEELRRRCGAVYPDLSAAWRGLSGRQEG